MRAWIISDIHSLPLDWYRSPVVIPEADVCVCAGDITDNIYTSMDYLLTQIAPRMPVVWTLGNHDCYGLSIDRALEIARHRLTGTNVHLLENRTEMLAGVRFIGATLWTDFEVPHGTSSPDKELPPKERRDLAFHVCLMEIADFRQIYRSDGRKPGETGFITVEELVARHMESRAFIESELAKPFDGSTVVVTHHAASPRSIHPSFLGSPTNGAFASDLTQIIRRGRPTYWIHGHIHYASDYIEAETRVLCNPRGYRHERDFTGFRLGFVVEI